MVKCYYCGLNNKMLFPVLIKGKEELSGYWLSKKVCMSCANIHYYELIDEEELEED